MWQSPRASTSDSRMGNIRLLYEQEDKKIKDRGQILEVDNLHSRARPFPLGSHNSIISGTAPEFILIVYCAVSSHRESQRPSGRRGDH